MPKYPILGWILLMVFALAAAGCGCGDDDDDNDDATADDDTNDDDVSDDDVLDDDADDDAGDDDTGDDDTVDDDTIDDDTGDDDTVDDDTADDDTTDDDTVDDDTFIDDDSFAPDDCNTLEDPGQPGSYTIVPWEYGDASDPDARTTNIFQFFPFPDFYVRFVRGISMQAVPLHAVGYYPDGAGPFPLVLIVHGNHDPAELSYPGYDYLTSQLASWGFIAVSVEEDFLNGSVAGEMDARGIVLLRHLQLFREWNNDPTHPLYGKIDMNWIGLAGHSRGGEAIGAAWLFNTSLHDASDPLFKFHFNIRSLFAIAPVDGQLFPMGFDEVVLENVDYFIMHGSHDGDVSDFQGKEMYDRALPVDQPGDAEKALLFAQGANHGQWNEIWAPGGDPWPPSSPTPLMSAADQQAIGLIFMTGWFRSTLQGRACYRLMLAGEKTFASFPAVAAKMNLQYQNEPREFINHYEEDSNTTTGSLTGAVNTGTDFDNWSEGYLYPGSTRNLILAYDVTTAVYRVNLPSAGNTALDDYDMLSFVAGQMVEDSDFYNVYGEDQNFSVRLVIEGTPSALLPVSDYRPLISQCRMTSGSSSKTVGDTIRIPLDDFGGGGTVLPSQVDAIEFVFDQTDSGYFGIDDIQFTVY